MIRKQDKSYLKMMKMILCKLEDWMTLYVIIIYLKKKNMKDMYVNIVHAFT